MMNRIHRRDQRGSASVIVVMVMLLLVVFGVLAFVSAGSSLRLAEKNARTVKDYYRLDFQGEVAVGQISALLESQVSISDLAEAIRHATGLTQVAVETETGGTPVVTLEIQDTAIENGASLRIRFRPAASGGLEVLEWRLVNKPFVYEQEVDLWEGVN